MKQAVTLVLPGDTSGWDVEMSARIVRSEPFARPNRRVYGARYELRQEADRLNGKGARVVSGG